MELGARVPLDAAREAVLELRRGKGMVLDAADHDTWSAGSFFTNPILEPAAFEDLRGARPGCETRPRFAEPDGRIKTSAAWLIEQAGFRRGDARGGVALSGKHVLALTNRGAGTTAELVALRARDRADGRRAPRGRRCTPSPCSSGSRGTAAADRAAR